jgi:antitoxin YefM
MDAISYTAIRNRLAKALDQVNDDRAPILITRQNGRPAVLMSLEDYREWEETVHLLRSPKNAGRIDRAIRDLEAGGGVVFNPLTGKLSGRRKRSATTAGGSVKARRSSSASKR